MKPTVTNPAKALTLLAIGLALAAMGIYVVSADDAPGTVVTSTLLMVVGVVLGVRAARNWLPRWATRTTLGVGVVVAVLAAFLIHRAVVARPLFAESPEVPSAVDSTPSPQYAAAVERAREFVRAAVLEQNLPGVSVAVGAGGTVVWAEGFGWRDVVTRTPVRPTTRFNIGTAARAVTAAAIASAGMTHTGTDSAANWSPAHIGEPEEDPPPFTFIHDVILRRIGLADAAQPLPGHRATFYVPSGPWQSDSHDPHRRRLMPMRDLACCADGKAFSSTPSDLVRFALATNADSVSGELAGGTVMSLINGRKEGVVVAVASNIAYANTAALANKMADVFGGQE